MTWPAGTSGRLDDGHPGRQELAVEVDIVSDAVCPFFLVDRRFAVTGAQDPTTWDAVLAHARKPEVRDTPPVDLWAD